MLELELPLESVVSRDGLEAQHVELTLEAVPRLDLSRRLEAQRHALLVRVHVSSERPFDHVFDRERVLVSSERISRGRAQLRYLSLEEEHELAHGLRGG